MTARGPDDHRDWLSPTPLSGTLRPGAMLNTVILGPPIAGLVRTWSDDESRLWQIDDAEMAALIGQGLIARTEIEPGRYREAGFLSSAGDLLLQRRVVAPDGVVEGFPVSLRAAREEDWIRVGPDRAWGEFSEWLGKAAAAASVRGEFLVVEPGGWESSENLFALFVVAQDEETGTLLSHVESVPAPRSGMAPWDNVRSGLPGATISAPASADTIGVVGIALTIAASEWSQSPWDLVLTYGRAPAGPVSWK
jgi:hypothetical protein